MSDDDASEYYRPTRDIHPNAQLPDDPETMVWRYMDWWKFEALVRNRALYLRRLDLVQDKFEGSYSAQQIMEMEQWLRDRGYEGQIAVERRWREERRKRYFVNCWCMNDHELDLLWRGYTGGREAVAIKSGLGKLVGVCDAAVVYWPLDISVVKYIDHRGGAFIDYMDGFAPVISKDIIHVQDQELRIIHWSNYDDPPDHVSLPVDLASITERIVLVPGASEKFKDRVIQLLQDNRLDVPVERSRSDAQPMR